MQILTAAVSVEVVNSSFFGNIDKSEPASDQRFLEAIRFQFDDNHSFAAIYALSLARFSAWVVIGPDNLGWSGLGLATATSNNEWGPVPSSPPKSHPIDTTNGSARISWFMGPSIGQSIETHEFVELVVGR